MEKFNLNAITVIKKNGEHEVWNFEKIKEAVKKSASRVNMQLSTDFFNKLNDNITELTQHRFFDKINKGEIGATEIPVYELHEIVQIALSKLDNIVFKEYHSYRDYKKRYAKAFDNIAENSKYILTEGSKENANKDSSLVSTKKELIAGFLSETMMKEYELSKETVEAHEKGNIHIHDLRDRIFNGINCCLFDLTSTLKGGFEINGVHTKEPNNILSFFDVTSDIVMSASSQQYGGFTLPEFDTVAAPFVRKDLKNYKEFFINSGLKENIAEELAEKIVFKHLKQKVQSFEYRLNTTQNCNANTPFITLTFGLETSKEGQMVQRALLEQRMNGLGNQHIPAIFPKLVFLHRNEINGVPKSPLYDIKQLAIKCSSKCMYPDWLSLDKGYLKEMYDKHRKVVSPMGCRAYLSPYYKNDEAIFIGRANCGAVSLNLPRFAILSKGNKTKFYDYMDKYFDIALQVHLDTFEQLRHVKASTNPLFFTQGGCHIKLNYDEPIERAIRTFTWSFGYIGLNEVSVLLNNGKEIHEDNSLAIEILEYLKNKIENAKKKHNLMFALYSTPAESLCFKFRDKDYNDFGEIEKVTDKAYYMNSFHVNVDAHINAIKKQEIERPMFEIATGGRIVYNEFPQLKNLDALEQCIDSAMNKGEYYGINLELDTCLECGYQGEFKQNKCSKCGSKDITQINRVCGYLGYKTIKGDTRFNKGKLAETKDRVDHCF